GSGKKWEPWARHQSLPRDRETPSKGHTRARFRLSAGAIAGAKAELSKSRGSLRYPRGKISEERTFRRIHRGAFPHRGDVHVWTQNKNPRHHDQIFHGERGPDLHRDCALRALRQVHRARKL